MSSSKAAIVTPVRGRFDHLVQQRRFLRDVAPGTPHVVVAVDMPDLASDLERLGLAGPELTIVRLPDHPLGMPTAQARNLGARTAFEAGADLVVFLDVDCAPLRGFVEATVAAHRDLDEQIVPAVLNGIVTYLPESAHLADVSVEEAAAWVDPHPVRPAPPVGDVVIDDAHHLLWSLAFAVDAAGWQRIGGFDEAYVGYGAEDTDFGRRAAECGMRMAWVGGAHAVHQWHPSANPPVHHVVDIVRNATVYFERWGTWPMEGWLQAFADAGLVEWTADSLRVAHTSA